MSLANSTLQDYPILGNQIRKEEKIRTKYTLRAGRTKLFSVLTLQFLLFIIRKYDLHKTHAVMHKNTFNGKQSEINGTSADWSLLQRRVMTPYWKIRYNTLVNHTYLTICSSCCPFCLEECGLYRKKHGSYVSILHPTTIMVQLIPFLFLFHRGCSSVQNLQGWLSIPRYGNRIIHVYQT